MKTCAKCGDLKPLSEFHKRASKRDGRQSYCKVCSNAANAVRYAANPDKIKAAAAASRAANPEKARASATKWKMANSEKVKAYGAAWHAANRDRVNAKSAAWRAANPEKAKAACAAWRAANQEKFREQARVRAIAYYAAHPDKVKARAVAWNAAHPEVRRIQCLNRRARQRVSGVLSKGLADKLFKLQRGKCACGCKQPLGTDYHLDHRMPLALGGTNTDDNMQLLTATCNMQKSAKHPIEFMQQRGFLL